MDKWALKYKSSANFVCVCCAGPELATEMGTRQRLSNCVNGVILRQEEMPRWGQLGCNGFIVLSKGHQEVVEASTSPFMQVRGLAFKHVESLLNALLAGNGPPLICPGQFVRISGLQKSKELNGQTAVCLEAPQPQEERCLVQVLQQQRSMKLKLSNLELLDDDEEMESDEEEEEFEEQGS